MNKPKLIAVDDQPENLRLLVEILKNEYSVIATTDPKKTFDLAAASPKPAAILLDISMPEMSGYDVIEQLKANPESASIPVIFVTGDDHEEDYEKGFQLGVYDYVNKPISPSLLKARIKHCT